MIRVTTCLTFGCLSDDTRLHGRDLQSDSRHLSRNFRWRSQVEFITWRYCREAAGTGGAGAEIGSMAFMAFTERIEIAPSGLHPLRQLELRAEPGQSSGGYLSAYGLAGTNGTAARICKVLPPNKVPPGNPRLLARRVGAPSEASPQPKLACSAGFNRFYRAIDRLHKGLRSP